MTRIVGILKITSAEDSEGYTDLSQVLVDPTEVTEDQYQALWEYIMSKPNVGYGSHLVLVEQDPSFFPRTLEAAVAFAKEQNAKRAAERAAYAERRKKNEIRRKERERARKEKQLAELKRELGAS